MTWSIGLLSRDGDSNVESDGRCVSSYVYTYRLQTDGAYPSCAAIATALGVSRGSPCPENSDAIAHNVKIKDAQPITRAPYCTFVATVSYATNAPLPDADDDDPMTRRVLWSISPTIQSTYLTRDKDGEVILDSAGQPFDGGVPVDERMGTVTATRNVDAAGYDKAAVMARSGNVNLTTYLGGAPGTVQVDISAVESYEGGFHLWKETYTFSYRKTGWQPSPLQAGFYLRDEVDGEPRRIKNSDVGDTNATTMDNECPEPQPLDDDGLIVPAADRPANCVFKTDIEYFPTYEFSLFSL